MTHVDYSARLQTVHRETNPRYHALLSAFKARPAARCWSIPASTCAASRSPARRKTPSAASWAREIEVLVVGNCFLRKERQDPALKLDYRNVFDPD